MRAPSASQRGVLNPHAVGTHFHLTRYPPSEDLAFFVERHWTVRWDLREREPFPQEVLPHPCVNLVLEAGRSAVHGVSTRRFSTLLEGKGQVVGVKFRPGAFFPFVRVPMSGLTDRALPLHEVFGPAGADLEPAVLARHDEHEQIARVEAFLRQRLPPRDGTVATVVRVIQHALEHQELARVEDLSVQVGLSVRTLQRLFRQYVGVSPKWVLRRFRLHEAADRVATGLHVDWAAFAQELGYFDQAHFIHDFKAQVGRSPTEYAALCGAHGFPPGQGQPHPVRPGASVMPGPG
ncbi:helix-turn-helix domain-containing protein [Archangium lipolyticum]|uniref:helix-turn-helix domain-containing protein n=1 Tax=Archangium lipolyticum TaxID=2970465 RepID=UPI0027D45ED9|nr:AraC family transcriptional regulator [Archangium lipolyticum]